MKYFEWQKRRKYLYRREMTLENSFDWRIFFSREQILSRPIKNSINFCHQHNTAFIFQGENRIIECLLFYKIFQSKLFLHLNIDYDLNLYLHLHVVKVIRLVLTTSYTASNSSKCKLLSKKKLRLVE